MRSPSTANCSLIFWFIAPFSAVRSANAEVEEETTQTRPALQPVEVRHGLSEAVYDSLLIAMRLPGVVSPLVIPFIPSRQHL